MVSSKTVPEDLNLKLRSKFNLAFTSYDCLHGAILKVLYDFTGKINYKATQFIFRNVQSDFFLRSWKCLKSTRNSSEQPVESNQKLATKTSTPHLWYSYIVTNVAHCYAVTMKDV